MASKREFALVYLVAISVLPTWFFGFVWGGNLPVLALIAGLGSPLARVDAVVFLPLVLIWALLYAVVALTVSVLVGSLPRRFSRVALAVVLLLGVAFGLRTTFDFAAEGRRYLEGNLLDSYFMLWRLQPERRN